jgi:stringent starvation protein B
LPVQSIMGIYARENGQGMIFQSEDSSGPEPSGPAPVKSVSKTDKPPRNKKKLPNLPSYLRL